MLLPRGPLVPLAALIGLVLFVAVFALLDGMGIALSANDATVAIVAIALVSYSLAYLVYRRFG